MKLHFLILFGGEASGIEIVSDKLTPVDDTWKNPDVFKLPPEISLRTERADHVVRIGQSFHNKLKNRQISCMGTCIGN